MNTIKWNRNKLRGRIKEKGYTQKSLAKAINENASTFSLKMNSKVQFTESEIHAICNELEIEPVNIGDYFFTL